jgi:hypothetical protein
MKKFVGGVLLAAVVCVAAVLSLLVPGFNNSDNVVVDAATTENGETYVRFDGWYNMFRKGDDTRGIFIMKDKTREQEFINNKEFFVGSVEIMPDDPDWNRYDTFRFRAMQWINETWVDTSLFTPDDQAVDNDRAAIWRMSKALPAGKYGIRVTAMLWDGTYEEDGLTKVYMPVMERVMVNGQFVTREVSSTYVILYADNLEYINCVYSGDNGETSVYDTKDGFGSVTFSVRANAGSFYRGGLTEGTEVMDDTPRGNLMPSEDGTPPDVRLSEMDIYVMNSNRDIVPVEYTISGDKVTLQLPETLAIDRYIVRVNYPRIQNVYGQFIIENGYTEFYAGAGMSSATGVFIWILGLIIFLIAIGLLIAPSVMVKFQTIHYKRIEDRIQGVDRSSRTLRGGTGEPVDAEDKKSAPKPKTRGFWKNLFGPPLPEAPVKEAAKTDDPKALQDTAVENIAVGNARSHGFLGRLHENRAKREMARQAGLSMDEFRELEEKQKQVEAAKTHSLSDFRSSLEGSYDIAEKAPEKEEAIRPVRAPGTPEFELLDSVKEEAPFREAEFTEQVIRPNMDGVDSQPVDENKPDTNAGGTAENMQGSSILQRLRNLTGGSGENQ